jgi:chemotaxis protein CheX
MGNMIMGNAGVLLADYNIDFEITPPSLLTGEKIQISSKYPTLVIPLEIGEWGQLAINVSVKEREAKKELA